MATNKNADVYRGNRSRDSNQININVCELEQSTAERTLMPPPINRKVGLSDITNSFWKRRNQKLDYKSFDKSINSFILSKRTLAPITIKSYIHVLEEFLKFSPNFNPADIPGYLKYKFQMEGTDLKRKEKLFGNAVKHANIIKQYFVFKGIKLDLGFQREYYSKSNSFALKKEVKIDVTHVIILYTNLTWNRKYQDSIIIHLMYSLGLDPYHLFSLRYEDIISPTKIQWWDYKASSIATGSLYYDLWSDIKFLKDMRIKEDKQYPSTVRTMIDLKEIKGNFIITSSPSTIYNRFKRSFSKIIPDLSITPKDIVNLSRTKSSSWAMKSATS